MKRILILFTFSLFIQGCASSLYVPITPADMSGVKGARQVIVVNTQTPPMIMTTPRDVMVESGNARWVNATAGYREGTSAWARASHYYKFPDPTPVLVRGVYDGLKKQAGLGNLRVEPKPFALYEAFGAPGDKIRPEYKKRFGNVYLLELRPLAYQMNYLPAAWNTYSLVYRSQALLVDLKTSRVLWRGFCAASGYENKALRYSWKKMDDAEAARLREGIRTVASACAEQLVGQFQGKNTKP